MNIEALIVIVGGVIGSIMAVNAFFLRGIYSKMTTVEISVAEMIIDSKNTKLDIRRLEDENKNIRENQHRHATEITKLIEKVRQLNKEG